jgi:hypothetical protein
VQLKCYLLSLLRIHRPDCQRCAREKAGGEMRKRLEDLNWRTQSPSLNRKDPEDAMETIDSKSSGAISPPASGNEQEQQQKKTA